MLAGLARCAALVALACWELTGSSGAPGTATGHEGQATSIEQLRTFELLDVTDIDGHSSRRQKRHTSDDGQQAESGGILEVKFNSFGRHFHLYLTRDSSIFGSGFEAHTCSSSGATTRLHGAFADDIYVGHVSGEVSSRALARWENGLLVAKVETTQDTYYLEPLSRLVPQSDNRKVLAYRQSDLLWIPDSSQRGRKLRCGSKAHANGSSHGNSRGKTGAREFSVHTIKKRSAPARNTCGLFVIADYLFFRDVAASSETIAGNYMIDIVSRVDKIYRSTQFSDYYNNMGFSIKKILIHTEWSADYYHYNFPKKWTADELLNALGNYSAHRLQLHHYCLVHLFTANAQLSSILGYASIADKPSCGGICSQRTPPPERDPEFLFNNTGFSTVFFGGNSRLLSSQAEVLLAHELGHNWGSHHDPMSPMCYPLVNGTYLMSEYTPDQPEPNNQRFSNCSTKQISNHLEQCADQCFEVARDAQRGNYRIDDGEECDAGVAGDRCCSTDFRLWFGPQSCSETNSECCKNCFAHEALGTVCRHSSDMHCLAEAKCDGEHTSCPVTYKEVGTRCFPSGLGRCRPHQPASMDVISCAPICEVIGLRSCLCSEGSSRCRLCCQMPAEQEKNSTCEELHYSVYLSRVHNCGVDGNQHCRLNETVGFEPYVWDGTMQLPPDTPCAIGYCDTEGVCKKQSRDKLDLPRPFSSGLTVDEAVKFMMDNVVGTVIILSLLVFLPLTFLVLYLDSRWYSKQYTVTNDFAGSQCFDMSMSINSIPQEANRYSTSCAYLPVPASPSLYDKEQQPCRQARTLPPVLRLLSHDQYAFAPGFARQTSRDKRATLRHAL